MADRPAACASDAKLEIVRMRNRNRTGKESDPRQEGIKWLISAADEGSDEAMILLSNAWFEEHEGHREALKALGWTAGNALTYLRTALGGKAKFVDACYNLAILHMEGVEDEQCTYLTRNPAVALMFMRKAANAGDAKAKLWVGVHLMEDGDEEAAVEGWDFIQAAADDGLAAAQVHAAKFLIEASEDDPDLRPVARKYLERAIDQEEPEALFLCAGLFTQEGGSLMGNDGVDYTRALRLYERAGVAGHPEAWCCAGAMHYHGLGTPRDHLEAYRSYERAAQLGSLDAFRNIAYMHFRGEGPLKRNREAAREIMRAVEAAEAAARKPRS